MNILIIEDNKINQTVLKCFIHSIRKDHSPVNVFIENNGKDALYFIKNNNVDLILSDFKMPIMDGLEFAREFRKIDSKTPIVLMTCNYEEAREIINARMMTGIDLGINDLLKKPLSFDKVRDIIYEYHVSYKIGHSSNKMAFT